VDVTKMTQDTNKKQRIGDINSSVMICPNRFREFRRAWNRYKTYGKDGIPHIMNPNDPRKKMYLRSLKDVRILLEEDPELMDAVEDVEEFETVFRDLLQK
jgi:hypothetical protein